MLLRFSSLLLLLAVFQVQVQQCNAFAQFFFAVNPTASTASKIPVYAGSKQLPSPEESASILTEFMAKAHEEKLRAVADVEKKYKTEIAEITQKLQEHEAEKQSSTGVIKTSANSYEFPATNKDMIEKVKAYQKFMSEYTVKAQIEKVTAVAAAEKKLKAKYEAIIAELKLEPSVLA